MSRPWQLLARADTSSGVLELRQRGEADFLISQEGRILMSSAARRSEEALGRMAVRVAAMPRPRVLIGGLGMGCTLRAALDVLPEDACVVVAELHEVVIDWCRGPLAALTEGAVLDPRVRVEVGDVARAVEAGAPWQAILLDLFEGPAPGERSRRHPHYGEAPLARCYRALSPGGVLGVWCEDPVPSFERRLARVGFRVSHERPGRGGRRHAVVVAER